MLVVLVVGIVLILIVVYVKCKRSKKTAAREDVHYDYPEVVHYDYQEVVHFDYPEGFHPDTVHYDYPEGLHYDYPYKVHSSSQPRTATEHTYAHCSASHSDNMSKNVAYHARSRENVEQEEENVQMTHNIAYSASGKKCSKENICDTS